MSADSSRRISASRPATSSTSAWWKEFGSPFCSHPVIPESAYPSHTILAMPSTSADAWSSAATPIDERFAGGEVVGHLPVVTVGADHQDHPMTVGGGAGDRATGAARLVVRMGVEAHDRRHRRQCASSEIESRDRSCSKDRCGWPGDLFRLAHRGRCDQLVDALGRQAPVGQHVAGVLAGMRRGTFDLRCRSG